MRTLIVTIAIVTIITALGISNSGSIKTFGKAIMLEASTHNSYSKLIKEQTN